MNAPDPAAALAPLSELARLVELDQKPGETVPFGADEIALCLQIGEALDRRGAFLEQADDLLALAEVPQFVLRRAQL